MHCNNQVFPHIDVQVSECPLECRTQVTFARRTLLPCQPYHWRCPYDTRIYYHHQISRIEVLCSCSYYTPQPWKRYWYNALQEMVSRKACISSQMSSEQCPMLNLFTTDDLRIISYVCLFIGSFSCTGTVSLSECFCLFGLLLGHFQPVPSLLWGLTS